VAQNGLFPQAPGVIAGTRLVFAVLPAAFALVTFACTFFYPVDAAVHRRIREVIAEKRGRGTAALSGEDAARFRKVTGLPPERLWAAK
jgi:Na+/melibiose symporter-like transporter